MANIEKKVTKVTKDAVYIDVEADTVMDFINAEAAERIEELDEVGPFAPKQAIPFITHKQNIPIYIILGICLAAHIWARVSVGMI